ncbi:MAG: YdcF family protein [Candidatus Saccharimonadales bacterium]
MIKWLIIVVVGLAAIIVGISFYLQPNNFIGCSETPSPGSGNCEKLDAIVVVSGGDTNARTDEGIKLFKNGWADTIIFSGAAKDKNSISNAAAMRLRALNKDVPADSILVDEFAETTEQNAANTQSIFKIHGFNKVMLVTSGYHQRRADLEFEKRAGDIHILNHPLLNDKDWSYAFWWVSPRGWWLAGGEIVKIIAFYVTGTV